VHEEVHEAVEVDVVEVTAVIATTRVAITV